MSNSDSEPKDAENGIQVPVLLVTAHHRNRMHWLVRILDTRYYYVLGIFIVPCNCFQLKKPGKLKRLKKMDGDDESNKDGAGLVGDAISIWLTKYNCNFTAATRHPFILSIRSGSVDIASFKRWLEQDYLFVRVFVAFAASVLIKACRYSDNDSDMEVLLQGMCALNDEIAWFKSEADKWGVSLSGVTPQLANVNYCRFLESLTNQEGEYALGITAFWAIESVYQESFAHCLEEDTKTPSELKETCQRWGNAGFGQYCHALREMANLQLSKASADTLKKAEATFLKVLDYEIDFWNMSYG